MSGMKYIQHTYRKGVKSEYGEAPTPWPGDWPCRKGQSTGHPGGPRIRREGGWAPVLAPPKWRLAVLVTDVFLRCS